MSQQGGTMQQQPSKRKMLWIFGIIFAVMILLGNSVLVAPLETPILGHR